MTSRSHAIAFLLLTTVSALAGAGAQGAPPGARPGAGAPGAAATGRITGLVVRSGT